MPTKQEREYYRMGFRDGMRAPSIQEYGATIETMEGFDPPKAKPKRKLTAWNKFVKANSSKKIYKFANGKLKLKKMGIAFRKTPAGRKK